MWQDGLTLGGLKQMKAEAQAAETPRPIPMKCPYCGHLGDKVVDSRESKEGEVIRRRRECLECGRRFTSYERIDEIPYMVVKKDGRRERFERQKLVAGLLKACEKRPVRVAALEAIADKIEAALQEKPEREIRTEEIGAYVMAELKQLDKVAFVRFASVYRNFRDLDEFKDELNDAAQDARMSAAAPLAASLALVGRRRRWSLPAADDPRHADRRGRPGVVASFAAPDALTTTRARSLQSGAAADVRLRRRAAAAVHDLVRSHAGRARPSAAPSSSTRSPAIYQVSKLQRRPRRLVGAHDKEAEVRDWMTTFDRVALEPERAARAERRLLRPRAAAHRARAARSRSGPAAATTASGRADFTFIR